MYTDAEFANERENSINHWLESELRHRPETTREQIVEAHRDCYRCFDLDDKDEVAQVVRSRATWRNLTSDATVSLIEEARIRHGLDEDGYDE